MIERAVEAGVPFGWVTADEFCGNDTGFRLWLGVWTSRMWWRCEVPVDQVAGAAPVLRRIVVQLLLADGRHVQARAVSRIGQRGQPGDGVRGIGASVAEEYVVPC